MSNRILVNTTRQSRYGDKLANAVVQLKQALDSLEYMRDIAAEGISGADYTAMEYDFGLAAGNGAAVYGYVDAVATAATLTAVRNLVNRVGAT